MNGQILTNSAHLAKEFSSYFSSIYKKSANSNSIVIVDKKEDLTTFNITNKDILRRVT